MYLRKLTISNYKSFLEPTEFHFDRGFNLLVGANSSGKTSVLEAIHYTAIQNRPHRSVRNVPTLDVVQTDASAVEVSFKLSMDELRKILAPIGYALVSLTTETGTVYSTDRNFIADHLNSEGLWFDYSRRLNVNEVGRLSVANWQPPWRGNGQSVVSGVQLTGPSWYQTEYGNFSGNWADLSVLSSTISARIYRFSAERKVASRSGHTQAALLPDSANLAYCMNHLQASYPQLFEELNGFVNRIFPTIHWVSGIPTSNNEFELKVQTVPRSANRPDLAVPIDQVGTGVFNAVAMLYVALTSQIDHVLLLEEPNSFLHPRALRELLAILAEVGKRHQFFITTHSSDVLRNVDASTVTLLSYDGASTIRSQASGTHLAEFREGLLDLGIRLTDLHGCDRVLWVEGPTEEAVFPHLLREFFPTRAEGIAVLSLHATGDFEARRIRPEKVAEIYRRLSQSSFLAPPMIGITLDRENKPESLVEQIKKDCGGFVHFLEKPMLEDYLLDADAIAAVLTEELGREVAAAEIAAAFVECSKQESCRLFPKNEKDESLHAANTLKEVFSIASSGTYSYHKVRHGPQLTRWILLNKPGHLSQLVTWLEGVLNAA